MFTTIIIIINIKISIKTIYNSKQNANILNNIAVKNVP